MKDESNYVPSLKKKKSPSGHLSHNILWIWFQKKKSLQERIIEIHFIPPLQAPFKLASKMLLKVSSATEKSSERVRVFQSGSTWFQFCPLTVSCQITACVSTHYFPRGWALWLAGHREERKASGNTETMTEGDRRPSFSILREFDK